ncbi:hypothetical protein LSUE1_G005999 [Lachnellula suecica]|uniref:BTB domain-containing protein n=1 Tax=Lachnellula suecica TaxID=602035 RepID=A0A8T9CD89_9HELO|nr:hypothetical protein LSUE1_G005999 [Lachnellula suecica]
MTSSSLIVKLSISSSSSSKGGTMQTRGTKRKSEEEPPTFKRRMGTEMVSIYVGEDEDEEHFTVHKELLCNKIPYFQKMFQGGFNEAKTSVARFPEDEPESFDLLLGWVYEDKIRHLTKEPSIEGDTSGLDSSWDPDKLYGLAHKLCIPELMDSVIDTYRGFLKMTHSGPSYSSFTDGYTLTRPGSPYRRFLALCLAHSLKGESDVIMFDIPKMVQVTIDIPALSLHVMKILLEAPAEDYIVDPSEMPDCDFHTHEKTVSCPWKKADE